MTFTLTAGQRSEIEALRDAMGQHNTNLGAAGALYDAIYAAITVNGSAAPGISPEVWTWIAGAKNVNAGIGSFAQLIRDNTARQWEIRYGTQMPQAELDKASNNIAYSVASDFLDPERTTAPDIAQIGANDAGAVAGGVFGNALHPEEPPGNWAAWAGTILFVNLGYSNFFQDYLLNGSTAGRENTKSQIGTYDLVAANQAIQDFHASLSSTAQSFFENLWTAGSLWWNYRSNLNATEVEGNNWFKAQYGLDARHAVTAGSDVLGPFDTATNVLKSATWHAGTYGNDTLTSALSGGKDVLNAGRGDDTISGGSGSDIVDGGEGADSLSYSSTSLAYRYQVTINGNRIWQDASPYRFEVEKIPALVSGPSSWDFVFNVESLTLGQYADTVKFNGSDTGVPLTIDGGPGTALDTLDLSAMSRALTNADFDGSSVTIGGATFNGFERLIGTSKDDTFILGSGGRTILGGDGVDTYVMGAGADSITDTNGRAIIDYRQSISGITLASTSGGTTMIGSSGWASGDTLWIGAPLEMLTTQSDDTIIARNSDITLHTYGGVDRITVSALKVNIFSGADGDIIVSENPWALNVIDSGDGDDTITVNTGTDVISTGAGEDRVFLTADANADIIDLGVDGGHVSYSTNILNLPGLAVRIDLETMDFKFRSGSNPWQATNDIFLGPILSVTGSRYQDEIWGSEGADRIYGSPGWGLDSLYGRGGDDFIKTIGGIVDGGSGNDTIEFTGSSITIDGGADDDFIYGSGNTNINGGSGNDVIQLWNHVSSPNGFVGGSVRGGIGQDTIKTNAASAVTIYLVGDGDTIEAGGYSYDLKVTYEEATSGVTIDGVAQRGSDRFTGNFVVNNLKGSAYDDVIYASNRFQNLYAGGGNDTFYGSDVPLSIYVYYGEGGNDTFHGGLHAFNFNGGADNDKAFSGAGNDRFTMGTGADIYHYDGRGVDAVVDFNPVDDTIHLPEAFLVRKSNLDLDGNGQLDDLYSITATQWFDEYVDRAYRYDANGNKDVYNYLTLNVAKSALSVNDFAFV